MNSEIQSKPRVSGAMRALTGTAMSRVLGLVREILMASFFGATPTIGAFFVAFRLSYLLRRVFAEGGLLNGFIPFYSEIESDANKASFFLELRKTLVITLISLIGVGEAICTLFFIRNGSEVLLYTMVMLPALLFICLYALSAALLYCHGHYFRGNAAPVMFNLAWIGGMIAIYKSKSGHVGLLLSIVVVVAFAMQWIFLIAPVHRFIKKSDHRPTPMFSARVMRMIAPFLMATAGVAMVQINSACDALFARVASAEGPAYLTYALRIQQLPLAFFAISLSTVLLSQLAKKTSQEEYREKLHATLRTALVFLIPSTLGIFCIGHSIIRLFFGRGQFDAQAVLHTAECFWGYGLSLIPAALVILLSCAFYARKRYLFPSFASALSIGVNVGVNFVLIYWLKWGAYSVAVSTAISSWICTLLLAGKLQREGVLRRSVFISLPVVKAACASVVAATACLGISHLAGIAQVVPFSHDMALSSSLISFSVPFSLFVVVYFVLTRMMKVKEVSNFVTESKS